MTGETGFCVECWGPIRNQHDLLSHARKHMVGTDGLIYIRCTATYHSEHFGGNVRCVREILHKGDHSNGTFRSENAIWSE